MSITATLPDGIKKEFRKGITGKDIVESIGKKLALDSLCIKVNEEIVSLDEPIEKDCRIKVLTFNEPEGVHAFRHSTCHILADAVKRLYPKCKNTIGPPVEEGFYYDFDDLPISSDDFPKIEAEMKKIVQQDERFQRTNTTLAEVKKLFKNNPYKTELAEEFAKQGKKLTVVKHGEFIDLCGAPHISSTGQIKAFKLLKVAGAYWRGNSKKKQLTRVYGISFPSQKQLDDHLKMLEEAERRDHRKIGKELELFMFHEWSPGSPFFLPSGTIIYNELLKLIREEYKKRDYQEVITPQLFNKALWEMSGHWSHYKENMFTLQVDNEEFSLKPMNCPSHALIFKSKTRSYRDLPVRIADFCCLHRNELKGVLGGLTRDRKFSQDDAHIFCTHEQIQSELTKLLEFVRFIYADTFNLSFTANLSTKPEKAMGDSELWIKAEEALQQALEVNKIKYQIKTGEGAFYGPKIDFDATDSIGRKWQLATIQLDFQMPIKFDATYEGADNKKHHCIMIHRAILGTFERFIGVLIENCAGKFPLWLSPVQARILTISEKTTKYAEKVKNLLKENDIRVELDSSPETINKKVRDAQLMKIPLMLTVGEKEEANETLAVRTLDGDILFNVKIDDFVSQLKEMISKRSLETKLRK